MEEMTFTITPEQVKKLEAWKAKLPKPKGRNVTFNYIFTMTGIGIIVKVKRTDHHEIDLTDYGKW
jgi:hypothetical protein